MIQVELRQQGKGSDMIRIADIEGMVNYENWKLIRYAV